jgi:mitogen-activated protein kinase 1/3
MQQDNSKMRAATSQGNDDRYAKKGGEMDKQQQQVAKKSGSAAEAIERPIKTKQIKGKTSFVCAGTTFVVDDKFEYIKQMGHGAYGVVCSAYDHKSKTKIAIKKVPKAFEDLIDAKRIVREIKLLKFFDHENVIALVDV